MAIYFRVEGPQEQLENREYKLPEIKSLLNDGAVGGYTISIKPFLYIFCDDDGLGKKLPINQSFKDYLLSDSIIYPHPVVGPVIAFTSHEDMLIFDGQRDPEIGEKFSFLEENRFPTLKEMNDWNMYHQIRSHLYGMEEMNGEYSNLFESWVPVCPQCYRRESIVQGEITKHLRDKVIIDYYCVNCEYQYDYETVI